MNLWSSHPHRHRYVHTRAFMHASTVRNSRDFLSPATGRLNKHKNIHTHTRTSLWNKKMYDEYTILTQFSFFVVHLPDAVLLFLQCSWSDANQYILADYLFSSKITWEKIHCESVLVQCSKAKMWMNQPNKQTTHKRSTHTPTHAHAPTHIKWGKKRAIDVCWILNDW